MRIKALMVDVDGVLVEGRPGDGRHWQTSLEEDLGFPPDALDEHFFAPFWDDIVTGRAGLMEHLEPALRKIAPHVSPAAFVSYWFQKDARLATPYFAEFARLRSSGVGVFLATNQEHLRAAYLMETLRLAEHVDGIFYSARLGVKKPDPEFFARIQAAVAVAGDELLLVDDSRANVDAAVEAGWGAHLWTAGDGPAILRTLCS